MAKHLYQKGKPGGPGRPKDPYELVVARSLSKLEATTLLNKFLFWTVVELEAFLKDKTNLVIEYYVAKLIYMSIVENNEKMLLFLFDRLFGKVVDKIEISRPTPTIIEMLSDKRQIILGTKDKIETISQSVYKKEKDINENNS